MTKVIFQSDHLRVEVKDDAVPNILFFRFPSHFTLHECQSAVDAWGEFCNENAGTFHHVWDCSGMKSFEMSAKKLWQETMQKYASSIDHISLVSDVVLIRGAARLMSKFVKLDLRVFKSLDELRL